MTPSLLPNLGWREFLLGAAATRRRTLIRRADGRRLGVDCQQTDGWLVKLRRVCIGLPLTVRRMDCGIAGEDHFTANLLDGSCAANPARWQWTARRHLKVSPASRAGEMRKQSP